MSYIAIKIKEYLILASQKNSNLNKLDNQNKSNIISNSKIVSSILIFIMFLFN